MTDPRKPWLVSYPAGVPAEIDAHRYANLNELFDDAVRRFGPRVAFINMLGRITYTELDREVEAFAAFLQQRCHLGKGHKIALMLPNLIQYPVALFGALRAGLTVINTNPLYTARELEGQLNDSGAEAIVVIANYADHLAEIVDKTAVKHVIVTEVGDSFGFFKSALVNFAVKFVRRMVPAYSFKHAVSYREALKTGRSLHCERPEVGYGDIAFLQYTGGTTGKPKGAMLSHGNIIANVCQGLGMYSNVLKEGEEVLLTAIPLYHVFAMTVNCFLFVTIGGTNLLITDPRRVGAMIKDLRRHPELTIMTGVNTLFNALLNHPDFKSVNLSHLKLVIGGGAAVQSGVDERFFKRTGLHILEGYGLTECSPLCCVNPSNIRDYNGTIGLPVPSTQARIVAADGHEIWDLNEPGELQFKGPQVMQGYYHNEKATAQVRDGDYLLTGDIAVWQEGGYIKIIDRKKDMILVSGFNVFPSEIEDVVSRNERIVECAVIGIPSETSGEAVKLIAVRRDPSLTEKELRTWCRQYLTPYKVPRVVEFVDALPKSAVGKVLRRCLRENGTAASKK